MWKMTVKECSIKAAIWGGLAIVFLFLRAGPGDFHWAIPCGMLLFVSGAYTCFALIKHWGLPSG